MFVGIAKCENNIKNDIKRVLAWVSIISVKMIYFIGKREARPAMFHTSRQNMTPAHTTIALAQNLKKSEAISIVDLIAQSKYKTIV